MISETIDNIATTKQEPHSPISKNTARDIEQLRSYWHYYAGRAHTLYKQGHTKQAASLFTQCAAIARRLLKTTGHGHKEQSGIELFYFASHNLAACQNLLHQGGAAEYTLEKVYQTILNLCNDPHIAHGTKLDALAVLDKSLFSLCSQLAYLGKVNEIHPLITETDEFAERIAKFIG